MKTESL